MKCGMPKKERDKPATVNKSSSIFVKRWVLKQRLLLKDNIFY